MAAVATDPRIGVPEVDEWKFAEPIWYWRGPAPYHYVTVPERVRDGLREWAFISYGWGMIPVTVRLGASQWATSLWPKDGGYIVPLRAQVRRREQVELGDTVTVGLTIDL
jgi:hypothetical protein